MKQVVIAIVALLLGMVLGGVYPRYQLRQLSDAVDKAEECKPVVGRELASMFGNRPMQISDSKPKPTPKTTSKAKKPPMRTVISEENEKKIEDIAEELEEAGEDFDSPRGKELAREALELRRTQARAKLVEDADPTDAQLDDIDEAIAAMNDDLRSIAQDFIDTVADGEPARRDVMGFAAEALDTMIAAEDGMTKALSSDQVDETDEGALDPFAYVDPSLIDLLQDLDQ